MVQHPAFSIPFLDLVEGLELECNLGNVNKRTNGLLTQYTYTQQCTYAGQWNLFTTVARGIIVRPARIVALPFPKFFNLSENKVEVPDLPFQAYEKVDGSLIIVYYYDGEWCTATKGSFSSDQAQWAQKFLKDENIHLMDKDVTYLFEAIYPENKIVISYGTSELVCLGGYNILTGEEIPLTEMGWAAPNANVRHTKTYSFSDLNSIVETAITLPGNEEGYVIRYEDGTRVKIKGAEYCRIHALISNVTPLAIWNIMMKGDSQEFIRSQLPEEFLSEFDSIVHLIETRIDIAIGKVQDVNEQTKNLSDKELGLCYSTFDDDVRKLIFPYRKNKGNLLIGRSRDALFRMFRPTGNVLPGYSASSSMNRIQDDSEV